MTSTVAAMWVAGSAVVWAVGAIFTSGAVEGRNEKEPAWNQIPVVFWPVFWLLVILAAVVGRPLHRLGEWLGRKLK